jgi:hypothetical protein
VSGHLANQCAEANWFECYLWYNPLTAGSDECYQSGEDWISATYANAVADIPNGTMNLPGWSNWELGVGVEAGWVTYVAGDEDLVSAVVVSVGGVVYDTRIGGWSETPAEATLRFRWDHHKCDETERNWAEGFDLQVRIKSSPFSGLLHEAATEGALIGSFSVTDNGGANETMVLDAMARAQINLSGPSYIGFFPVLTSAPAEHPTLPEFGQHWVATLAAITNVRMALA